LLIESLPQPLGARDQADVAAAFQLAVADSMADRVRRGASEFKTRWPQGQHLVVAGGVAANTALRQVLVRIGAETGLDFLAPPLALCTDNAAMIAWAGIERLRLGLVDDLTFAPRPRWPLDPNARKGAKA
ncbi:MAG: tRNA (adenosine(37)-N6)-threonylcarbamoyltransferase complex transferase subunit TsaD, partial [Magnetospirillum sp.]|nr:tRNA (adenosine(37)-N6)-threonylcarbamoyltransferase complex transferase subunit TsaD [Magnetospirillum sp.]